MIAPRHILHVFSTFAVGGQQIRFVRLAGALGKKYRHSVIALDGNADAQRHLDPGLGVSMVESPVVKCATLCSLMTIRNLMRIRRAISVLRPDFLCTYNWGAIEWALANRFVPLVPQLQVEDGFGPDEADRQLPRRVWARRLALGHSRVLVPSLTMRRIALETWRLSPPRVLYVPNGIPVEHFAVHATDRRPLAIGTLATLRAEKNIGRLMRAFAALPPEIDAELVVIGGGPLLETLQREAAMIDPRIRFPGPAPDPAEALKMLDLFALSSDTEQMPLSILEAMAAGLPIVSIDVGDVRNMLPAPSQRWVTPRGDDHAFARALAKLAADAVERRVLSEVNRTHVSATYTESTMLAAWDRLFAGA